MISPWTWFLATLAGVLVAAGISAAVKASPLWRQTAAPTNAAISPVTLTQSPSGSRAPAPVRRCVVATPRLGILSRTR